MGELVGVMSILRSATAGGSREEVKTSGESTRFRGEWGGWLLSSYSNLREMKHDIP